LKVRSGQQICFRRGRGRPERIALLGVVDVIFASFYGISTVYRPMSLD
jgi:hypothetical protein